MKNYAKNSNSMKSSDIKTCAVKSNTMKSSVIKSYAGESKPVMGSDMKSKAIKTNAGFTLLEALVALAILATSGTALLVFYSNAINGLIRATEIQETLLLAENLQPMFNTLTLQEETEQQMEFNGYQVHWHAKPVEPKQQGRNSNGAHEQVHHGSL